MRQSHRVTEVFSFLLRRWSVACLAMLLTVTLVSPALGQAGLREALERLDKNEDGQISPDEITPQARPYFERITENQSRSWREKPISIERLTGIARKYYYGQNGGIGRELRPEGESTIRPFGAYKEEPLVPDFGLARVKYPYIQADLDLARQVMRSYDLNGDGLISRDEASKARKWTHRNPFEDDLNKDEHISRMELTQRYARRRLLDGMAGELGQRAERGVNDVRPAFRKPGQKRGSSRSRTSRGSSAYLAASLLNRFDANRNGQLEMNESLSLGVPVGRVDLNQDGSLTRDELLAYLSAQQEQIGPLIEGLPDWFYELDKNRDEQVSMGEYTQEWTEAKFKEFTKWDHNGDGFVTVAEVLQSETVSGGSYANKKAELLSPRRTLVSEIEVSEDYLVGDLNLQISITHSYLSFLDCYLTGPDGQKIEVFTEVGGTEDHFEGTIFDDQSPVSITRARYPFKGSFQPEAVIKRQPSLSHFNGKTVKGIWQLTIRGQRSDRFGMLNGWALIALPQGDPGTTQPAPQTAPQPAPPAAGQEGGPAGEQSSNQPPQRPDWRSMTPEQKRQTAEAMAKRGLHPSGRAMTESEKRMKNMSGEEKKRYKDEMTRRGLHPSGRAMSEEDKRRTQNDKIRDDKQRQNDEQRRIQGQIYRRSFSDPRIGNPGGSQGKPSGGQVNRGGSQPRPGKR
jgi:subtilisin-like proprotein convertase family protein